MLSSPSGTPTSHPTARKRIIYAHSDILVRRSEYFAAMLTSPFAENSVVASNGERKLYTVIVEEADFETIYWLLKYCYANWLLFKQDDDPRDAVEGVGAGWSVRWLSGQHDEWEWKPFHQEGASEDGASDNKSATSGDSVRVAPSVSGSASNLKKPEVYPSPGATSMASSALKVNSVKTCPEPARCSSSDFCLCKLFPCRWSRRCDFPSWRPILLYLRRDSNWNSKGRRPFQSRAQAHSQLCYLIPPRLVPSGIRRSPSTVLIHIVTLLHPPSPASALSIYQSHIVTSCLVLRPLPLNICCRQLLRSQVSHCCWPLLLGTNCTR